MKRDRDQRPAYPLNTDEELDFYLKKKRSRDELLALQDVAEREMLLAQERFFDDRDKGKAIGDMPIVLVTQRIENGIALAGVRERITTRSASSQYADAFTKAEELHKILVAAEELKYPKYLRGGAPRNPFIAIFIKEKVFAYTAGPLRRSR